MRNRWLLVGVISLVGLLLLNSCNSGIQPSPTSSPAETQSSWWVTGIGQKIEATNSSIVTESVSKADTYSGAVSGTMGGEISFGNLAISFPQGASNGDIQVEIKKQSTLPSIEGTPEQIQAYNQLEVIGDIYDIKTSQIVFNKPFYLEMKFDPAMVKGKDLFVFTVADGKLEIPEVIAGDLEDGYVIVKGDHFSYHVLGYLIPIFAITAAVLLYKANQWGKNENEPWNLIEPNNTRILDFIKSNSLQIPTIGPHTERFTMTNYHKVFQEREATLFNRAVHLTGNKGSAVLDQEQVACWDLTTFFGSILYSMQPDMSEKIRLVKGTVGVGKDKDRHSWIEVVVGGQVFVVNTGRRGLDGFEFVARDVLYREQNLEPTHCYTKDPGSLKPYDWHWFEPYLYYEEDLQVVKIEVEFDPHWPAGKTRFHRVEYTEFEPHYKFAEYDYYTEDNKEGIFRNYITPYDNDTNNPCIHGPCRIFDKDGKLIRHGTYVDGKEEGYWEDFDIDPRSRELTQYNHGKKEGNCRAFWAGTENQVRYKGKYLDDNRVGIWVYYRIDGTKESEVTYKDGEEVEGTYKEYAKDGITVTNTH